MLGCGGEGLKKQQICGIEHASARGDRLMGDGTYHLPIAGVPKHSVNISIGVRDHCVLSDKSKKYAKCSHCLSGDVASDVVCSLTDGHDKSP